MDSVKAFLPKRRYLLFFLALKSLLFSEEMISLGPSFAERLFQDLELVEKIDQKIKQSLPLIVNDQLQGGYFTMPSARTFKAGHFGFGFSYVPPYHVWGLGLQFFDHIETTGNYWVYKGIPDGIFGHLGFGDSADRTANVKFVLLRKEDGLPSLPEFAIGWNDFMGTRRFKAFYVVATQDILCWDLEASLGWGSGRMKGFYGGLAWSPFRQSASSFFKGLSFVAEYDANDYKNHPEEHPLGREVKHRINAGVHWNLWDRIRLSGNTLRGKKLSGSIALNYPLGDSKGLLVKVKDPSIYSAPVDREPVGLLRSRKELAQELVLAFQEQGFDLYDLYLVPQKNRQDFLWLKLINVRYREEEEVRSRIEYVLAALIPENVTGATVVIESDGLMIQEYRFRKEDLLRLAKNEIGKAELRIISPAKEVGSTPNRYDAALLYKRKKASWMLTFRPWFRSFLGSSRGKFKYETGLALNPEGYLFDQIYYNISGTYTVKSSALDIQAQDILNPSRLINVRTDSILYNQSNSWHLNQAYLQKSWNLGYGWFSRLALGYFEQAYAGLALEALYYPVDSNWAIGMEAASLLKRSYYGIGFQDKVRKLTNDGVTYVPYRGLQYFLDVYYQYRPLSLDFKFRLGQFLAKDKGLRIEGGRTFASGVRIGLWYTFTNAGDVVNQERYYDKGFSITIPLDLFLNHSSRTRIGYAMSAWLRDCGAMASTGKPLYPTLFWQRYHTKPVFY